jgi:hypothetical protein
MRNSRHNFRFEGVLVVLIAVAASIAASAEGVPPGSSGGGALALGGEWSPQDELSIDVGPAGATLALLQDQNVNSDTSITISAPGGWTLIVEDLNAGSNEGKMRKYQGAYVTPEVALSEQFAILVEGIGDNDGLPETITLTDAYDISPSPAIVESTASSSSLSVDLRYSQKAVGSDSGGYYRIDLRYTLSSNA